MTYTPQFVNSPAVMGTVCYSGYWSTATASASNASSIPIVRAGTITAIDLTWMGSGGAANGYELVECILNQAAGGTGVTTVNNPQRQLTLASLGVPVAASTVASGRQMITNVSIPVAVGDLLNTGNVLLTGTAPSNGFVFVKFYVLER